MSVQVRSLLPLAALICLPLEGVSQDLTFDERVELMRGLTAEYATVEILIPQSKKPLLVRTDGTYDQGQWDEAMSDKGPAARAGDTVQITKVTIEDDRILFEIDGGVGSGRKWYQGIELGMGDRTTPIYNQGANPTTGTNIGLIFEKRVPPVTSAEVKKMLAPLFDFETRSATEHYVESLPPEIQTAIREEKAIEGMDKEQVQLALGRPVRKIRETVDDVELEDWVYGTPPGAIVFVTFDGDTVVRVKQAYAGLGGEMVPPIPPPR